MQKHNLLIVVCLLIFLSSCNWIEQYQTYSRFRDKISANDSIFLERKNHYSFLPNEFNETSRLYYIAKVWGFLKYYHENTNQNIVDVDLVLIDAINKSKTCHSKTEFQSILANIISSIQISDLQNHSPFPENQDYMLIDNNWMNDTIVLSPTISKQLNEIFLKHSGKENPFIEQSGIGRIRLLNETNYPHEFPDENLRLLGLFRYWNIINYFFVYKNFMDENWDNVLYESIPIFKDIHSEETYHWEIARLTNKLGDGHANMPTLNDSIVFGNNIPNFNITKIQDTFLIREIMVPEKNIENFQVGDILLEINNQSINFLYDSLKHFVGSGSYWAQQRSVNSLMLSDYQPTTRLKLLRNGKDTLTLTAKNTYWEELTQLWTLNDKKEKQYQWINDSIAYIDTRYLTSANFNKNYKPIKKAKAIIIDLRCYPDNFIMAKMIDAFVPPSTSFAIVTYPDIRFPGMVRYHRQNIKMGSKNYFQGHTILLVNELTGSFSEYLTMALQQNPRTITVGRSTAGSNGNIVRMKFPGEIESWHSGVGIYYPDFTPTQRTGIKIDYIVEPDVTSVSKNIDVALEKAKDLAKNGR